MVFLKIRGVDVDFPFEPYACQRSYMEKVIQCLQEGTNGVLESPTGTGKTLCLLCATLAWRAAYVAKMQFEGLKQHFTKDEEGQSSAYGQLLANQLGGAAGWGNTEETTGPFMEIPKIIYASRTHSQLSQAVAELKNTSYSNLKVCILGSREQLCIHPEVQEQTSNSAKVHMCKAKTSSRLCVFHNNLDEKKSEKDFTAAPLDIEDLVKVGRKHKVCPYYMARELKTSADIIFMPYNYLLDPKSRKAHSVDLKNHIVVFDEAHNLEKMCEDSSSFDLTAYDLASCVEELDNLHKSVAEIEVLNEKFHTESSTPPDFSATELIKLKSMLLELEKKIDSLELPANGTGLTKPGSFLYELFAELQITFETAPILLDVLDKVVAYATTNTGTSVVFGNKAAGVSKLGDVLKIAFSHDSSAAQQGSNLANLLSKYYKVFVKAEEGFQKKSKANADPWATTSSKPKKQGRTLSYWCFSPGHAMQDLASHGVHSIILTSGTLSPLESFTAEMHIDFPVHLENPHVIDCHQVWLGMVTKGPDGVRLNSSYENRNSTDYINSLGNAIVNFARIVPNGLLVFFPSYPVMNKCLEVWQDSGISNRISQYKTMVVEPRGKTQFVEAMEQFYEKINDPTLNGAAFFAVCRGKVSEGLDFADINGRAVVITGLPFPPRMDPKVVLKMGFLDEGRNAAKGLTGRQWYRQQASRAVNQAIGRVIRHRQDYGAILLCDHRFTYADARAQLPSWVRPYATTYNNFGQAIKDLTSFFKTADRTLPQPAAKNKTKVPVTTASFQPSHSRVTAGVSGASCRNSCQEARRIDSHVPSLRRSPEPRCFDNLKIGYTTYEPVQPTKRPVSSTGLFDALKEVEDRKEDEGEDEAWTDFLNSQDSSSSARPTAKPVMRKRIRIVKWKDSREKNNTEPQKAQPSDKSSDKKPMLMPAEKYLAEVRRVLSIEKFKLFQKMLGDYKKTDDFNAMVTNLADLFTEDISAIHLFREFYKFVRPHHKKRFDQTCQDITGQGCGYKPEHSVSRKCLQEHKDSAQATKKRRLNSGDAQSSTAGMSASGGSSQLDSTTHLNKGGKHLGSSSTQSASATTLSSWLQGGNTKKNSSAASTKTQENSAASQSDGALAAVCSTTHGKEGSTNENQKSSCNLAGSYNDLRTGLQDRNSGLSNRACEMGGEADDEERRMNALFDDEDAD